MKHTPSLQEIRTRHVPKIPEFLSDLSKSTLMMEQEPTTALEDEEKIQALFPQSYGSPIAWLKEGRITTNTDSDILRIGVVFSGGQAPGGHNVITGLYDALKRLNSKNQLIGVIGGPNGLVTGEVKVLTEGEIDRVRNQGGFDLIGSGRTKLESPEQLVAAEKTVKALKLNGLIIIGGDDSNTNAALLAEFFRQSDTPTHVVGVPKTIDGDLKNEWVELSFGHDTACRLYSELIGNICRDVASAKKYYHFIKLMGRAASHIALECALQTQPTYTLISEEVAERKQTLGEVVTEICKVVKHRYLF
jgi:pyrophosphate--fructose-6-phosphate 1-phosphotransferase